MKKKFIVTVGHASFKQKGTKDITTTSANRKTKCTDTKKGSRTVLLPPRSPAQGEGQPVKMSGAEAFYSTK